MKTTHTPAYVWQLPIRFFHWINAACIVVLFLTGIFIGRPFASPLNTAGDGTVSFLMGYVVYTHMVAAYIFIFNFLFRIYWWIAGNAYSRFRFRPWTKQYWVSLWHTVKFYLFFEKEEEPYLGHNPLAELSYFVFLAFASVFMIITGFVLYASINPGSILFTWFTWASSLLGGIAYTRFFHHLMAWAFIVFFCVHFYLCIRHDALEKDGTMSSIVNGWKFKSADHD
ncbi:MAG: Ni/Fe-hydrogenase, b-type cytochrome subunit [Heliobacteriaceae bacterium]|nr:Ni/Fe-hydrogenase, b-type cytochrome subunit [Heliobacteriaceae bacterium]MDD4587079.1 Ni/Fe-hydrogenase, b-type cytochrome subunit [Heliobacteriaceae bacterium]